MIEAVCAPYCSKSGKGLSIETETLGLLKTPHAANSLLGQNQQVVSADCIWYSKRKGNANDVEKAVDL